MRLVIEPKDFKRLSTGTQSELLRLLTGGGKGPTTVDALSDAHAAAAANGAANGQGQAAAKPKSAPRFRLRQPVDLTPDLTQRLLHGMNAEHKRRLSLFAEHGGRVRMQQLLESEAETWGETPDVRTLSHFEGAVTRRLRRILGDQDKVAYLIGWDYESTVWNDDNSQIVDGVYYVSGPTVACLREYFELD
jgi:hypothetical protein